MYIQGILKLIDKNFERKYQENFRIRQVYVKGSNWAQNPRRPKEK
jgi:hypothetical protein